MYFIILNISTPLFELNIIYICITIYMEFCTRISCPYTRITVKYTGFPNTLAELNLILSLHQNVLISAIVWSPDVITAPALNTLAASVLSASVFIPDNLVLSSDVIILPLNYLFKPALNFQLLLHLLQLLHFQYKNLNFHLRFL